ncbi:MAG: single-stranded-DNA-specific exonuclease RecJ [Anaerovibrio sp.]|uniref:single-stranded-DNA-specific exonuclease RecJ n=1 Tax=Anaerovibrio sp. TaxID=1872532 RepID=UPI0025E2CC13|nr:single-stranded-DNA-specific exonuclease RecJ [Anaerovibrio sp.]MCR5176569.1 single-stranded-DNA-specific exonuclease RecJ [Anaerovibrio sp.]
MKRQCLTSRGITLLESGAGQACKWSVHILSGADMRQALTKTHTFTYNRSVPQKGIPVRGGENKMNSREKWKIKSCPSEQKERLANELGISQLLAGVLINRGIDTREKGEIFLNPEKFEYLDPYLLPDMRLAVDRIIEAISKKEKIVVYGDYDADGITSTSLLLMILGELGADVDYYIPNRFSEGYGLNAKALDSLADKGTQLIITVDCGVKSLDEIKEINSRLDVVVTDHHIPGDELPEAVAVVDAHRSDSRYPCPELAGVGIAFKLCQGLWQELRKEALGDRGIELVALGTVADSVPLIGENRRIVSVGLKAIEKTSIVGMKALLEVAGCSDKKITSTHVGFYLGPRINATGRLRSATIGVELLTCDDPEKAAQLAAEINSINDERKKLKDDMQLEAEEQLKNVDIDNRKVLVVVGNDWHQGVLGLLASSLETKYYRPVIVISMKDGIGKGSCRSIPGFNLYEALDRCNDVLEQFGGHEGAAGLTIREDKIDEFTNLIEAEASRQMTPEQFIPFYDLDQEISPLEVNMEMVEELERLQPCGMKNESPLFCCRGVRGAYASLIGNEQQHLRFSVVDGRKSITALAFNMAADINDISRIDTEPLDVVYEFNINEWQDTRQLQCFIKSMGTPIGDEVEVKPDRVFLKNLYIFLKECKTKGKRVTNDAEWLSVRMRLAGIHAQGEACAAGLKIFEELGLLAVDSSGTLQLVEGTGKMNLQDSPTFCRYNEL